MPNNIALNIMKQNLLEMKGDAKKKSPLYCMTVGSM